MTLNKGKYTDTRDIETYYCLKTYEMFCRSAEALTEPTFAFPSQNGTLFYLLIATSTPPKIKGT
jgi:hypothetical protein